MAAARPSPRATATLFGLAALLLFGWQLGVPSAMVFDESWYVPAARSLLALNGPTNIEHPLFAKSLIAAGIALFGDNAIGWRASSVLAGALTVAGVWRLTWVLFGRARVASHAALFAMINGMLFVHARLGMLDAWMGALLVWGLAVLIGAGRVERPWWRVALAGLLFGLAIGAKWSAAPIVAIAGATMIMLRLHNRAAFGGANPVVLARLLGGVAVIAYLATFAPGFFYARDPLTLATLIPFQFEMLTTQANPLAPHAYQSEWWQWPLALRPIWYFYEVADGAQRGILLVGNPAILWGGLIGVAACLWAGIRERDPMLVLAGGLWLASYLPWALIPKSPAFFYHYHPAALLLCPALAAALHLKGLPRWSAPAFAALAIVLFAWFYPIIAAMALPDSGAFQRWIWFDSWR